MSQHGVIDLAATDSNAITSLSNPQKHALYTLIASKAPKPRLQTKYMGKRHSLIQGYNNALQDYDNAIKGLFNAL